LRDTVEDWNFTANQKWYTDRILPYRKTEEIHVQWELMENNPSFMEHTPHQAASHIVTQMRSIRRATLIRRGIGAEFEHDFIKTPLGRTSFVASLAQIARSFQETANVEVIRALLGCHRSTQVYIRKFGIIKDGEVDAYLDRKAARFMIAQKEDFGLEKLNVEIETEQEKYQGEANAWILSREVLNYCQVADPNRTLHYLGGQEAVDRINGRPSGGQAAGGTMGNVRRLDPDAMIGVQGVPVYLAKSYAVDNLGELELLARRVEVGVFNTMIDRNRHYKDYKTESRNIRVYDNDADDWAEISIEEAIEHCIVWAKDNKVDNPFAGARRNAFGGSGGLDDDDFLRIPSDGKNPMTDDIRYVGDMNTKFLKAEDALKGAQTIYNALQRSDPAALKAAEDVINAKSESDLAKLSKANLDASSTDLLAGFASVLGNLLGEGNLFLSTNGTDADTSSGTRGNLEVMSKQSLWNRFAGKYGAKKATDPSLVSSSLSSSSMEDAHSKFLNEVLGAPVPASHKDALTAIVSQRDQPWDARAQQIESLLIQALRDDPSSVPALGNEARVKSWMKGRKEGYEAKLQGLSQSASVQSRVSSSEVEYFPVGTPLPRGYEYLNANEAQRAQSGSAFPKSLSEFTFLKDLFVGDELSMGGQRRFSSIGAKQGEGRVVGRDDGVADASGVRPNTSSRLASRFNNLDEQLKAVGKSGASTLMKWLAIFYLGCEFSKTQLLSFATHNIYIPVGFLLLRPHATYKTRYGIKCAAGGKSGYTFFGHSDMQIAHDATRKVGVMHYTAYLAAVVTNPKNVYVVEDLFCEKYLGGMGVKFWNRDAYLSKGSKRTHASIICTMLPPSTKRLDKKIDGRGKFYSEFQMQLVDPTRMTTTCYPGAARTAMYLNWWDPVRGSKGADKDARSGSVAMNFVCWQGVQWHFNCTTNEFCDVTVEQGHFGQNVYPGCGRVRNGEAKYLAPASYLSSTGTHGKRY